MNTRNLRTIAATLMGVGKSRVRIKTDATDELSGAMTKEDVRELVAKRVLYKSGEPHQSRGRARDKIAKRKRGRRGGMGKRKGTYKARTPPKQKWMREVRALREELLKLKKEHPAEVEKIGYRKLYRMIKGNYFRGRKYLQGFVLGKTTKEGRQ